MDDKILSKIQAKAIKSIPKYGESNYKTLGIKPNTIKSLEKMGLIEFTISDNVYVRRLC